MFEKVVQFDLRPKDGLHPPVGEGLEMPDEFQHAEFTSFPHPESRTQLRTKGIIQQNKYPPAKPEVLRWLAPQRGLIAIAKSKPKTEKTGHCRLPELSNFGSPPAEPGVYPD